MPSDPMTAERLAEIKARVEAATPGEWTIEERFFVIAPDLLTIASCRGDAEATFIAHARSDIPALVAEVERLRAQVEAAEADAARLRAALEKIRLGIVTRDASERLPTLLGEVAEVAIAALATPAPARAALAVAVVETTMGEHWAHNSLATVLVSQADQATLKKATDALVEAKTARWHACAALAEHDAKGGGNG